MYSSQIVKNYAIALFQTVPLKEKKQSLEFLVQIAEILLSNRKISLILSSPAIVVKDKIALLENLLANLELPPLLVNFINILVSKSRIAILGQVVDYYKLLFNHLYNIKLVKVISAKKINVAEQQEIESMLQEDLDGEIKIEYQVDESVIGGLIIKHGNYLQDDSIAGVLKKISIL